MTTLSGIVTLAATCLFVFINLGLWQTIVAGVVGLGLIVRIHEILKTDPQEETD